MCMRSWTAWAENRCKNRRLTLTLQAISQVADREVGKRLLNRRRFSGGLGDLDDEARTPRLRSFEQRWQILSQVPATTEEKRDEPCAADALSRQRTECAREVGLEMLQESERHR